MVMNSEQLTSQIEETLHRVFPDPALFLVDCNLSHRRNGWRLVIRCETDRGITLEELTAIHRGLQKELVLTGIAKDELSLEVSSPGLAGPVKMPRHFRRHLGARMALNHTREDCPNPLKGKLVEVSDEGLVLEAKGQNWPFTWAQVHEGRVELDW